MSMDDEEHTTDELDDELDPSVLTLGCGKKPSAPKKQSTALTHHRTAPSELSSYIYPTNLQVRDYQYNIVQRAFFHNTLVVLPTGLGKTFIASTVILNYFRWFPDSKIVFMAPTKPLVAQQIKACCGTTGLPPSEMAILLDLNRRNRASIWDEKKVFFTTPQVVENDLKLGTVSPKSIVLLVIDEAHRAKGNYAYNNVVKFLDRFNPSYRILAMTATPASTVEGVQEIIDNLHISRAEVRTERSIDIFHYLKQKKIERFHAGLSEDIQFAIECISNAIAPLLREANEKHLYEVRDPAKINAFTAMDASRRLVANKNIHEGQKWAGHSILQILGVAGQCLRRLNIYGIRSFYSYFKEKYTEATAKAAKSKKPTKAASFYQHPDIEKVMQFCESKVRDPNYLGHEKLDIVVSEVKSFFSTTQNTDSRVIIFSEFRQAALDIVRALEHSDSDLKPHIFIGQAKDTKSEEAKLMGTKKKGKKDLADTDQTSSEMAQLTGMSQKLQKETIRKFKAGDYNILVATSIGEEGLDIGEVDLIVCYDSTSSPIKNIQRMGRTGRNRDGKILLLFSSNEEQKFDKAMGGYEYIQQHIMNGNLIDLHDQNRIIPDLFNPSAEKRFIQIPEENNAIKEEADDDEIIKLATKYMTGTNSKAPAKSTRKKNQPKIQKKFFMPDNVETGFQPVSSMLKGSHEDSAEPVTKKAKTADTSEPDILDSFLDSDVEDMIPKESKPPLEVDLTISGGESDDCQDDSDKKASGGHALAAPIIKTNSLPEKATTPNKVLRQPQLENILSSRTSSRTSSPSLGVRKRPVNVIDQLKAQQVKSQSEYSQIYSPGIIEVINEDDDDDFSDDDEILALARRTQSNEWHSQASNSIQTVNESKSQQPYVEEAFEDMSVQNVSRSPDLSYSNSQHQYFPANPDQDQIIDEDRVSSDSDPLFVIEPDSGILTSEEWDELHMNYYVPVDAYELEKLCIPQIRSKGSVADFSGLRSKRLLHILDSMESISEETAASVVEKYEHAAKKSLPPPKDIIEFD
ncbi:hypothetical protein OXX80_003690 [Metschnikowia pulcherrima]